MCAHTHTQSLSHVQLIATPWIAACQAPLSMGFSTQEYWSGLPFPTPDLPSPRIGPTSLASPPLEGGFFTTAPPEILLSHKKNKIMTFCNNVDGPTSYHTK